MPTTDLEHNLISLRLVEPVTFSILANKYKNFNKPPFTSPLVHIALMESVVMTHTKADMAMMTRDSPIPA